MYDLCRYVYFVLKQRNLLLIISFHDQIISNIKNRCLIKSNNF
jgi:hypothetical protein